MFALQVFLVILGLLVATGFALCIFGMGLMMLRDALDEWGWWLRKPKT